MASRDGGSRAGSARRSSSSPSSACWSGFGAWMAPTLHRQGVELRRQLPDAIDRVEAWINARRGGVLGMVLSDASSTARIDSTTSAQPASAGAPAQPRAAGDTARVPATLRERDGCAAQRRDSLSLSVPLVDACRSSPACSSSSSYRSTSPSIRTCTIAASCSSFPARNGGAPAKCCRQSRRCSRNGSSLSSSRC